MNLPNLFLIHGIRSKDKGAASMGILAKALKKHFPFINQVSYGYVLIPITNKKAVKALIKALTLHYNSEKDVVVVAYSNGCWAALQAAELGYKIDHLVLISPALHKHHAIPEQVKRIDVYYSEGDDIVQVSKLYSSFANLLPWNWKCFGGKPHDWGAMGKTGYIGEDSRVHNWQMNDNVSHFWYKYEHVVDAISSQLILLYPKE